MKKLLLSLFLATVSLSPAFAQQFALIRNTTFKNVGSTTTDFVAIPVNQIDKITYERGGEDRLLPDQLATDPKTTIFSAALQLTGLADTLRNHIYADYKQYGRYYYQADFWLEVAWYNERRYRTYTVFAETDEVLASQGITSLEQLRAYAKTVYDAVYPEDAAITDPTDRRNSLNRFVAYHVLPQGLSYYYLTIYDGKELEKCVDRDLTDIAAWYATLMPHAAMKCSYPKMPEGAADEGLYLNRRGLKDCPDRYGQLVRGAKILGDEATGGFDHLCLNGCYFHIDRILTYDAQTRDNVLGGELWRVDFKTLSPDIMNNADELRGNYLADDPYNRADDSYTPKNGRNYIYQWDALENFKANEDNRSLVLIARRAHSNFWSWQGDEVILFGQADFTVKLPPLPAGEWEIRMSHVVLSDPTPPIKAYLNDQLVLDVANEQPKTLKGPKACCHFNSYGTTYRFSENDAFQRYVLGRIQSDGKSDNYLRIYATPTSQIYYQTQLDYLEFVPKAIVDNTEIPEE